MVVVKVTLFLACCLAVSDMVLAQTLDQADSLYKDMFDGYNKHLRPVVDQSHPVVLNVTFEILSIQDVDEVAEKFTVYGLMILVWFDQTLVWDPASYGGVASVVVPASDIWFPDLLLTNPYTKIEGLSSDWLRARIYYFGMVVIVTGNVFQSSCSVDVKYYPYDSQECQLVFNPIPYGTAEVYLVPTVEKVQQNFFGKNGEWNLEDTNVYRLPIAGADNMYFEFKLKRNPDFIFKNVLLPIVFMAAINLLVFILPSESGERVGYSITVLLALAVFLTLVGDNLPKTSDPMPVLCNYLTVVLVLSVSMCATTIISLTLFHQKEDKRPPKPFQLFAHVMLLRCVSKSNKCSPESANIENAIKTDGHFVKKERLPEVIESEMEKKFVPWQDVSRAFDVLCFLVFLIASIVCNVYYIKNLQAGDNEADEK